MDSNIYIADYFNALLPKLDPSSKPRKLHRYDQIIYYVVAVRCEIDMGGMNVVFEHLLTEDEVLFFIEILSKFEEPTLSNAFKRAYVRFKEAGFYDTELRAGMVSEEKNVIRPLDDIGVEVSENNGLWGLDDRLVNLIPSDARLWIEKSMIQTK